MRALPCRTSSRFTIGFTLIELMVALAIMAIVAAVALPLYTQYSDRTFRTMARADLMDCSQALERWASVRFTYQGSADTDADGLGDADAGPIADEVCIPQTEDPGDPSYAITVATTATTFLLTATPVVGGRMAGDGVARVDDVGNREWDANNDGDFTDAGEQGWSH